MKINSLTTEEVFRSLVTTKQGLSQQEAQQRLSEFGPNRIEEVRGKPLILRFIAQFTHFLAVLLWVAAGFSFISEYLSPGEGMFTLGIAIIAVIVINAIFTFIQEYRAEKALDAMKKLLPFQVKSFAAGLSPNCRPRMSSPETWCSSARETRCLLMSGSSKRTSSR